MTYTLATCFRSPYAQMLSLRFLPGKRVCMSLWLSDQEQHGLAGSRRLAGAQQHYLRQSLTSARGPIVLSALHDEQRLPRGE